MSVFRDAETERGKCADSTVFRPEIRPALPSNRSKYPSKSGQPRAARPHVCPPGYPDFTPGRTIASDHRKSDCTTRARRVINLIIYVNILI
jgi:hypothetical protein